MKFYAVKKGKVPGIYLTWTECQNQTRGFSGAVFKSFTTLKEAESFVKQNIILEEKFDEVAYTDGSFIGGIAGGAAVLVTEKKVMMSSVEGDAQTNNRGELLGIILALKHTKGSLKICSDSQYSINILSNSYKAKENLDLVTEAQEAMKGRVIQFEYVPAHTGLKYNELADFYAKQSCNLPMKNLSSCQIYYD
jgi:ribonuclease HI